MKLFNLTQGMSKRRTGLAIARGIGWAAIGLNSVAYGAICTGVDTTNYNGPGVISDCYFARSEMTNIYIPQLVNSNDKVDSALVWPGYFAPDDYVGGIEVGTYNGWGNGQEAAYVGTCPLYYDESVFNDYTMPNFSANSTYCAGHKSTTHVVFIQAQTGATNSDPYSNAIVTYYLIDGSESTPPSSPGYINDPAPGSVLAGESQAITFTNDGTAENYWVQAGSAVGRNDYHDSGVLDSSATSEPLVNLPTNGTTIYVTVWYKDSEGWKSDPYQFTAFDDGGAGGSSTPPTVTSHTDGGALTSATETFTWSDVGADNYWLQIGSSAGRNDYHDSGQLLGTVTSQEVSDLPGDGTSIIHVRIWYKNNGRWEYNPDTSYTAATVAGSGEPTPPTMTLPAGEATPITTATQTFSWSAVSDSNKYWLQIGTSPGRNDVYDSSELATATDDASGLPTDSSAIYVRVWAFIGGRWVYDNFTYNNAS